MKTIVACSVVPKADSYIQLADISAPSEKLLHQAFMQAGLLMAVLSLLVLLSGATLGPAARARRIWRLAAITLVAVTLLALVASLLTIPTPTQL